MSDLPSSIQPAGPPAGTAGPVVASARVRVDVAAHTDRGHVREINEDSFVIYRLGRFLEPLSSNIDESQLPQAAQDTGYLMIVADGLGGHEGGEVASRTALVTSLQLILRSPQWALKFDDPRTRAGEIRDMVARSRTYLAAVHESIRQQAETQPELRGMGTTLTGAYSVGLDLFLLHVGDSRAYLMRDGKLRKLTHDHTVAQDYADQGVIQQSEVEQHHLQHVLTRAIGGMEDQVEGDMHHTALQAGDRLLLCSDGLTDMASESDIAQVLRAKVPSAAAARALVDLALSLGGRDNVTALVASYDVAT